MARSKLRRAVYALACMTPLLVACNAILGIDDYDKAECSGGPCLDDGGRADGDTDEGGRDAGPDVQFIDASGAAPVSWIKFMMPNYPEAGPDNSQPKYAPSSTADGGIGDSISRRAWRPVGDSDDEKTPKTLAEAKKLCEDVPGDVKWRVPTRIELVTLLDFSKDSSKATADTRFNLELDAYWTSSALRELPAGSTVAALTSLNWVVSFNPRENPLNKVETSSSARVICIQGL